MNTVRLHYGIACRLHRIEPVTDRANLQWLLTCCNAQDGRNSAQPRSSQRSAEQLALLECPRIVIPADLRTDLAIPSHSVTALLRAWARGDSSALDRLLPLVYEELRHQARLHLRRERADHSLQTTGLVHEAYLRLVDQRQADWRNRAQFYGVAGQMMRRVLIDHARSRKAAKRGGGGIHITLEDASAVPEEGDVDVLELDEALTRLGALDPQQARVVELRYFTGLGIEETAVVLGISPATVKRDWVVARAWLRRELTRA